MPTIVLNGRSVAYTVRRSPRARQVRLRVGVRFGLEIVVPAQGRLPDIPALLRERAAWVLDALDRLTTQSPTVDAPLTDGAVLPYLGFDHRLSMRAAANILPAVEHDVSARTLTARFDPARYDLAAVLEWWFRGQARDALTVRAAHFAPPLGVSYARLTVRDTRSRWGSCSSRGGLNFSWRLILAPPPILDYVVIHELAHLREMNHSPRFWAILAEHCPDYQLRQVWLREHGPRLMVVLRDASPGLV